MKRINIKGILAVAFLLSGIFLELFIVNISFNQYLGKRTQKLFIENENYMLQQLHTIYPEKGLLELPLHEYQKRGLAFFAYKNDSLLLWTDNTINPEDIAGLENGNIIELTNRTYYAHTHTLESGIRLYGLMLIYGDYPIENEFIRDAFNPFLKIPLASILYLNQDNLSDQQVEIYNAYDERVFTFIPGLTTEVFSSLAVFPALCYFFALISFLLLVYFNTMKIRSNAKAALFLIFTTIAITGAVYILTYFKASYITFQLPFFSPEIYASSLHIPSLGNLLLYTLIFGNFLLALLNRLLKHESKKHYLLQFILHVIILFLLLWLLVLITRNLIENSTIGFLPHRVQELSVYSFTGYLIIAIILLLINAYLNYYFKQLITQRHWKSLTFTYLTLIAGLLYVVYQSYSNVILLPVFFMLISVVYFVFYLYGKISINLIIAGIILFFNTLLMQYLIFSKASEKQYFNKQVLAVDLAAEHDMVAEVLLENMAENINNDIRLKQKLFSENFNFDEIFGYIKRKYFSGFWNKYEIQITACGPDDEVYVEIPDDQWYHCYSFFDNLYEGQKEKIENSEFYFINNANGRISYSGEVSFIDSASNQEVTLFIELNSKLISRTLGYPELLLDEGVANQGKYEGHSYAKYNEGHLIYQYGDFPYSLITKIYPIEPEKEFGRFTLGGYQHLYYKVNQGNLIIISSPSISALNIIISFSYFYLFLFAFVFIGSLILKNERLNRLHFVSYKEKIQAAILLVSLISFVLLGGSTIFFSIRQYQDKHYELLSEKIQSVYVELDHKLAFEDSLSADWNSGGYDNLNQLLIKFSDVFYTDINLYDTEGRLISTSRPELYSKQIISNLMNPVAFTQMKTLKKPEFIHEEHVGKMQFYSGYVPFFNIENKLLAYLNLPYFTRQDEIRAEVSNLLVTVVNIYILIVLITLAIGIFLSEQLTKPLKILQSRFREVNLGKQNEKIEYKGKDEIAALVKEYNRMVDELERNIQLLSKTEREIAWREMAKQIAHEIKNPLTPMKLSIQHLNRIFKEKPEEAEQKISKVSASIIQQIDNLTNIANAFSNFAKMPTAQIETVDLAEIVKNSQDLFDSTEEVIFKLFLNTDKAYIKGDKEQLNRVLVNLIKNAIQSIPEGKDGKIELELNKKDSTYVLRISDNGSGIPEELEKKLFQPNFTTKTGGMGLGLAIVKRIIENFGGQVYYKSIVNKGTSFFIELPALN